MKKIAFSVLFNELNASTKLPYYGSNMNAHAIKLPEQSASKVPPKVVLIFAT